MLASAGELKRTKLPRGHFLWELVRRWILLAGRYVRPGSILIVHMPEQGFREYNLAVIPQCTYNEKRLREMKFCP